MLWTCFPLSTWALWLGLGKRPIWEVFCGMPSFNGMLVRCGISRDFPEAFGLNGPFPGGFGLKAFLSPRVLS